VQQEERKDACKFAAAEVKMPGAGFTPSVEKDDVVCEWLKG
jgi:hypothetical protein